MNTQLITPAATVLVIRDGKSDIEVFMVERSNRPPFGNLFVFPGGKIDTSDNDSRAHSLCKSISDDEASALLGIKENGLSYWVACVRECFEEVGILLAEKKDGAKLDLNGIEKEMFSPSFALLNGFRSSKNGWEFGFGPTFRLSKISKGYYKGNIPGGSGYDVVTDWVSEDDDNYVSSWAWDEATMGVRPQTSERADSRGDIKFKTGWVWAIGRTFHSGYLNIPVNLFYSSGRDGGYIGLSMGFNIAKKD